MLIKVAIKHKQTQLTSYPATGAKVLKELSPTNPEELYDATRLYKGWFYLKDLRGWVYSKDVYQRQTIEPYDPDENVSVEADPGEDNDPTIDNSNKPGSMTPEQLVAMINKSTTKINSKQITYTEDGVDYPLYGFIKNLKQSLDTMNECIDKISNMPEIPKIPDNVETPAVLKLVKDIEDSSKTIVEWAQFEYNDLINKAEDDPNYSNDF